jgi:cytochrome c oxidase subunit III
MGHDHGGDPSLAHHFDNMQQQFEAGKLGMWLFLATEVLLFAGLFCAYTVYRYLHPEVFEHASGFLDTPLGATNTAVLLASSFSAALAVRAAQLKNRKLLVSMLIVTILGACGFLVIKYIEYKAKFHHHTLWGMEFDPRNESLEAHDKGRKKLEAIIEAAKPTADAPLLGDSLGDYKAPVPGSDLVAAANVAVPPTATAASVAKPDRAKAEAIAEHEAKVRNVHVFFGIYFCMTGLHGIHVVIGMIVLIWLLIRANRGDFDEGYYLPVDLGALYWHLVDLIWIFLFPLLYLI